MGMTQQFFVVFFCPWWPWPLTFTFKLIRARHQTRLPCKFAANPLSRSRDIWCTNKMNEKVTDSAKNKTLLACGNDVHSSRLFAPIRTYRTAPLYVLGVNECIFHYRIKATSFQDRHSNYKTSHVLQTSFLWSPYVIGQTILSSFFFLSFFSSPNLSGRRLDVYHTLAHGVALVRI